MKYRVRIQAVGDCWLAPWSGDPGRTTVASDAVLYASRQGACLAIERAKKTHSHQERVYTIEEAE